MNSWTSRDLPTWRRPRMVTATPRPSRTTRSRRLVRTASSWVRPTNDATTAASQMVGQIYVDSPYLVSRAHVSCGACGRATSSRLAEWRPAQPARRHSHRHDEQRPAPGLNSCNLLGPFADIPGIGQTASGSGMVQWAWMGCQRSRPAAGSTGRSSLSIRIGRCGLMTRRVRRRPRARGLQAQAGCGVVGPDRAGLDVAAHHGGRPPAAVAHDGDLGDARCRAIVDLYCRAGDCTASSGASSGARWR